METRTNSTEDTETGNGGPQSPKQAIARNKKGLARWGEIWQLPCGPREVLAVGLPLVVSTLSYSVMQFFDRLFLAWHSELEMAAVMPAVILTWTAASLPMGIASYAATFVAQYSGSGRERKIGAIVWTACWLGVFFVPIFILISLFARQLFLVSGHSAELVPLEAAYFRIACYGSPAVVFESALGAFFIGQGRTTVVMLINLSAMFLNLVLDWWMVFGFWIVPEMGIAGAAWATTVSVWFKVLIYLGLILKKSNWHRFGLRRGIRLNWGLLGRLLRFGGPSGWQLWIEGAAISVFIMFVGRIGVVEAAATTLAFSVNLIAFIPVVGMGMSVSTLVGQKIGSQQLSLANRAVWTGLSISVLYSLVFALLYFLTPRLFLMAHSSASVGPNFEAIESTAVFLLRFVAAYCLFDCVQVIFVSALKGAGDTRFIFFVTIINAILFIVLGILGVYLFRPEYHLTWWWAIITLWIVAYAVVFFLRFRQGQWAKMSVIRLKPNSSC